MAKGAKRHKLLFKWALFMKIKLRWTWTIVHKCHHMPPLLLPLHCLLLYSVMFLQWSSVYYYDSVYLLSGWALVYFSLLLSLLFLYNNCSFCKTLVWAVLHCKETPQFICFLLCMFLIVRYFVRQYILFRSRENAANKIHYLKYFYAYQLLTIATIFVKLKLKCLLLFTVLKDPLHTINIYCSNN